MPWARVDDGFHAHPKTRETSLAARGLLATALSFCANYLTDGYLPTSFVGDHATGHAGRRALRELVEREWLRPAADGGYLICQYLDWNPSREQVDAARSKERDKKADQRRRRAQATLPWDGQNGGMSPGDSPRTDPSSPSSPNQEPPRPPAAGAGGDDRARGLWQRARVELRKHVTDYTFHIWIEPLTATGFDGATLTLRAPDNTVSWVRDRYLPLLRSATTAVHGAAVTIEIPETASERRQRENEATAEARRQRRAARADAELAGTSPGDES